MAYEEKYYHQYCDAYGNVCRISILEDGYVGSVTEVEAQEIPILITYDSESDFKYDPIRSSSCEVFLTFGTGNNVDFEEFWTADERRFKVEHYIDSEIDWVGYVIPNGFGYELRGGIYYASILASDGLSTLEGYDFLDDNTNTPYGTQDLTYNNGFEFPFILIATEILRKIGLDLNTWSCIDVFERSMTSGGSTRDSDPLATSYVNVKTYINDSKREDIPYWRDIGEVFNCREVLENLCYLFGAKVYQSKGSWRIKRVNSDVDYGTGATQRYWHKYNTLSVYLGREIINDDKTVLCNTMIGNDHVMRMDEVYKAFRMNYEYTFVREGDSFVNQIKNGSFSDFTNDTRLAAPDYWIRWRIGNKWHPRLQGVVIDPEDAFGNTTGVEMGTQKTGIPDNETDPNAAIWAALEYNEQIEVFRGDKYELNLWQKLRRFSGDVSYMGVLTIAIKEHAKEIDGQLVDEQKYHYLTNDSLFPYLVKQEGTKEKTIWTEEERHLFLTSSTPVSPNVYQWEYCDFETIEIPVNGTLVFRIHGLSANRGRISDNYPGFKAEVGLPYIRSLMPTVSRDWIDEGGDVPRYQITGIFFGTIPATSELPQQQDFIYENNTGTYSLEPDPIKVYNGDVQDIKHISNIIVPSNVTNEKNFWDTIDDKYGGSSLGLNTVRSIMNQYFEPKRIIEGTIKLPEISFDSRFEFEFLPSIKFIIQRGSFNRKKGYFQDAMFVQITENELPTGGTEGGNNVDPDYQDTGRFRCEKDGSNLNTGFVEYEQIDVNPNSETYQQVVWDSRNVDTTLCPLGQPNKYYWGADDVSYEIANFESVGYEENTPSEIEVDFNNDGGLYLYFLHLSSEGLVEGVEAILQPEIISDWQYLADTTIDGFTYRVLRMNYETADFTGLSIIFKFT